MNVIDIWRRLVVSTVKYWVVFEHGTVVFVPGPKDQMADQARRLLEQHGPVQIGTPSADLTLIPLDNAQGWVIEYHHPSFLSYVSPDEFEGNSPTEVQIGLRGRSKREQDAKSLSIIHLEDRTTGEATQT